MVADIVDANLPIQRRRTAAAATPSPLGSLRASPTASFRVAQDGGVQVDQLRRWADYTPNMTPSGEDKSSRLVRMTSMDGPSMLFPPTPSPNASPLRYVNFGLPMPGAPLPGLPEGGCTFNGLPQQQPAISSMMVQPGMAPPGQMVFVQLPAQMQMAGAGQMQHLQMQPAIMPAPMQGATMMPVPGPATGMAPWAPAESSVIVNGVDASGAVTGGSFSEQQGEVMEVLEPTQDVTHLAGRQLFSEALDSETLDRPAMPAAPLPSPGSAPHGTGRCNPCAWYWKAKGCTNGATCTYCHLCPEGELKNRKKAKVAALRMGAIEPAEARGTSGTGTGQQPAALKLTSLI